MGVTMTDADMLFAAVRAAPADDAPRLRYADWLDEHGEPDYAAFIRQCISEKLVYRFYKNPDSKWAIIEESSNGRHPIRRVAQAETGWLPNPDRLAGNDGRAVWLPGIGFVYARGFVAEVRCTLAAWCGGECPRCDGDGRVGRHWDPASDTMRGGITCPTCKGDKALPGIGGPLLAAQPVVAVRVTDVEPLDGDGTCCFYFTDQPRVGYRHRLPTVLRRHFQQVHTEGASAGEGFASFPTRDAALSALGRAALQLAAG